MAAKTIWHRYRTKLPHCHPMYTHSRLDQLRDSAAAAVSRTSLLSIRGDHAAVGFTTGMGITWESHGTNYNQH